MVAVSETAVRALAQVVADGEAACRGLRIMVEATDCSGPKYLMGVETEAMSGDIILDLDGLTLFIDQDSHPLLRGTQIDFVDDERMQGFTFDNPNFPGLCQCGEAVCP